MFIPKKVIYGILLVVLILLLSLNVYFQTQGDTTTHYVKTPDVVVTNPDDSLAAVVSTTSTITNSFFSESKIEEAGSIEESSNANWWVNSGGRILKAGQGAQTVQGNLSLNDKWRVAYAQANPMDTDNGYHPQNIFRLVNKNSIQNFEQSMYFQIEKHNISSSTNRNESNGVLLFNRYQDGNNLYYTGVRVDGGAVIKKKINGVYFTMADVPFFSNGTPYNRDTNPNLLPQHTWIGIKSGVTTLANGTVKVSLYVDRGTGVWTLAAEAIDDGVTYGGAPILTAGHTGIRTDFMDVSFKNYKVVKK